MLSLMMWIVIITAGVAIAALVFAPLVLLLSRIGGNTYDEDRRTYGRHRRAYDEEAVWAEDPYDDPVHEEYRSLHWN